MERRNIIENIFIGLSVLNIFIVYAMEFADQQVIIEVFRKIG